MIKWDEQEDILGGFNVIIGSWPICLLFWVTPLLTFYAFYMQLREMAHHSNAPADGEFRHSTNFHCNPMLNWAVFPYGQD